MHVSFALFADAANLSQEGKLNILGVFDSLQVGSLPAIHPRAHMIVQLKGSAADAGTHTVGFRWLNPNGKELWSSTGDLNVATPPAGVVHMDLPLIAQLDLPLDAAGGYTMAIAIDGSPTLTIPVQVRTAPPIPVSGMMS